jgi:hypothetical protein
MQSRSRSSTAAHTQNSSDRYERTLNKFTYQIQIQFSMFYQTLPILAKKSLFFFFQTNTQNKYVNLLNNLHTYVYIKYCIPEYCNRIHSYFISQSWGDHTDVSQALAIYMLLSGSVYVYCWLGDELSEQVRICGTFKRIAQVNVRQTACLSWLTYQNVVGVSHAIMIIYIYICLHSSHCQRSYTFVTRLPDITHNVCVFSYFTRKLLRN